MRLNQTYLSLIKNLEKINIKNKKYIKIYKTFSYYLQFPWFSYCYNTDYAFKCLR